MGYCFVTTEKIKSLGTLTSKYMHILPEGNRRKCRPKSGTSKRGACGTPSG